MNAQAWLFSFLLFLGIERCVELVISRRNEAWIRARGGMEYGQAHTRALFTFHFLWFVSFVLEASFNKASLLIPPGVFILAVLLLQSGRYWCIKSLGRFWNTKILVLPGASAVHTGPYRLIRHPNYLVVLIEIVLYPALFGFWLTALFFGLANLWFLRVRIGQEERALAANTD